jgi:hypothetical protein
MLAVPAVEAAARAVVLVEAPAAVAVTNHANYKKADVPFGGKPQRSAGAFLFIGNKLFCRRFDYARVE